MKEYEYSFEVENLKGIFKYLDKNNYKKVSENFQERIIYENETNVILRLTTDIIANIKKTTLDLKTKKDSFDKVLNVSKESLPLLIEEKDYETIETIINILDYKKYEKLVRKRYIYKKDDITFEIDEYTLPRVTCVVALEGEPKMVDIIYNKIKNL